MTETSFPQYQYLSLLEMAGKLRQDHYKTLEAFCGYMSTHCDELKTRRLPESSLSYVLLCERLAAKLQEHITLRNEVFIPYLKELNDKEATNHNCTTCSGRCEMNHSIRLMDMRSSLVALKDLLYNIRWATLQEGLITDAGLRLLHRKVALASNVIDELIMIEEEHLIPGVMKAQRNIHVAS